MIWFSSVEVLTTLFLTINLCNYFNSFVSGLNFPDCWEPFVLPLHEPCHCGTWCLWYYWDVRWRSANKRAKKKPGFCGQDASARRIQQDVPGRQRSPQPHQWISQLLLPEVQVWNINTSYIAFQNVLFVVLLNEFFLLLQALLSVCMRRSFPGR